MVRPLVRRIVTPEGAEKRAGAAAVGDSFGVSLDAASFSAEAMAGYFLVSLALALGFGLPFMQASMSSARLLALKLGCAL